MENNPHIPRTDGQRIGTAARELMIELTGDSVVALVCSKQEHGSAQTFSMRLPLEACGGNVLKAFETVVYDNAGTLLEEYCRTRLVVRTQRFTLVPPQFDDSQCRELLELTAGKAEGAATVCRLQDNGPAIAFEIPTGVDAFVQRTFPEAAIVHHLYPLIDNFVRASLATPCARLYLNLRDKELDIVAAKAGKLLMASTNPCLGGVTDAVYFALGTWRSLGLDPKADQLLLTGDNEQRQAIAGQLRDFVGYVMPNLYPPEAMRLGKQVMDAPYELVMMALCE